MGLQKPSVGFIRVRVLPGKQAERRGPFIRELMMGPEILSWGRRRSNGEGESENRQRS